ncbi:MAG TPA: hypothetical protein VHS09_16775 [Polyangiaceae bacterium]|nr:hypothetical protein [Polyangiaceae bacterium]
MRTALRTATALAVLHLALGWTFSWISHTRGLLSPGGAFHADVALLGAAYLFVRVVVRFALPALLAGAVAAAVVDRVSRASPARSRSRTRRAPRP